MKNKIVAGIVTYNPEISRLKDNIDSIINQVEKVIIVDNASDNIEEIVKLKNNKVDIIINNANLGIAVALNLIMSLAEQQDATWVITLDQDSICPAGYIEMASRYFDDESIGQITPLLFESKAKEYLLLGIKLKDEHIQELNKSITSASINRIEAWKKIGRFDDDLFIDYVDYDYSIRLCINNYKIIRLNDFVLDHHIGNSENKRLLFLNIRVANHSVKRKYYISRNIIIFMRRYHKQGIVIPEMLRLIKLLVITMLFENEKKPKYKAIKNGIKDGLQYSKV